MSLSRSMIVVAFVAGTASAAPRCRPIAGVDQLFAPGRIVLVGEVHGTREIPRLFVCHAAANGYQVAVGIEYRPDEGESSARSRM